MDKESRSPLPSPSLEKELERSSSPTSKDSIAPPAAVASSDVPAELEKNVAPPTEETAPPPEGGWGWVCVAACASINGCSWGINSAFGVYLSYYLSTTPPLFPSATSIQYAFVGGLTLAFGMISSIPGIMITRRYGMKLTLILGCICQFASLLGASFATEIWHIFLSQGILFGFGMGLLFVASVGVLPQWFSKRRSVANGVAAAGSGIGGLAWNLGTNAMLKRYGLGWTFRITGIIAFTVNMTSSLLLRDRNHIINPNQKVFDFSLVKKYQFILVMVWGIFSMLGYIVILYSLPNYGLSVGLTKTQGSIVGAMLNLGMAIGRPLIGLYSDRMGRINIAGSMTLVSSLTVFVIWIVAKSFGVMIFFAIVNGAVCGVFWTTIAPICAEVVGLVDLPSALNLTWLSIIIPMTFAEAIGLELRTMIDGKTSYLDAQIFSGFMFFGASVAMYLLRTWKIGVEDEKLRAKGEEAKYGRGPSKWLRWAKV